MTIIFFDDQNRKSLYPLSFTRPIADFRIGILKISEKWLQHFSGEVAYYTESYLQIKFPFKTGDENLFINGSICPNERLVEAVNQLDDGEALLKGETLIAVRLNSAEANGFDSQNIHALKKQEFVHEISQIKYPEDLFKLNNSELRKDYDLLTKNRTSHQISNTNTIIGHDFFAEEGVEAECSSFNTKNGPIYLGKNAQVWEGCHIRGALALCNDSQIKMGAKIYGATTIGPFSRVGGEINNAVIFGHSSKGHEGYLGNAVLGEWCNIGADSNNSNLKNNYAEVRLWDYETEKFRKTGLQFCGLIMADHAKCGINTMFNTGTVVGVGANVFGAGYPRNFIPDFAWGGAQGFENYSLEKMFETASLVFERRNKQFDNIEKDILTHIFEQTKKLRRF